MSWENYTLEFRKRNGLLIGINGVARSGKDTVGNYLVENYGFEKLSFAEALRKGLYAINPIIDFSTVAFGAKTREYIRNAAVMSIRTEVKRLQEIIDEIGWEQAKVKYTEIRELMQRYGTEGGRDIHGINCWTNIVKQTIQENSGKHYVITDARFVNELQMIGSLGGVNVQIKRPDTTSVNSHISDSVLPEMHFNEIINNDGTLGELYAKVDSMMKELNPFKDSSGTHSFAKVS